MSSLSTDLFDYELPARLIAQAPTDRRDHSRLLVVDRAAHRVTHHHFSALPPFLRAGDTLIRNTAAVLPARLRAQRPTGGAVECLLLRPELSPVSAGGAGEAWWCLVRPGRKLDVGATFADPGAYTATVDAKRPDGTVRVRFTTLDGSTIIEVAQRTGEMPLPPYIERQGDAAQRRTDLERYQTVYADRARPVAVAAPTAGLHFTPELLQTLTNQGVLTADVTLHVGLGTFRPIASERIDDHVMHQEFYEIPPSTQEALYSPRGRRVAVGTTSVRSIEDFLAHSAAPSTTTWVRETGIFLHPPASFRGVDALITNFHQPRSTLLCLVAAFLAPGSTDGIPWLREIYAEAIRQEYRFFSYGDAMLVL